MTIEMDVKSLNKTQVKALLKEMIHAKLINRDLIEEVLITQESATDDDMSRIDHIVNKHFEQYDEVFRKLA